jgi:hypothetical protein
MNGIFHGGETDVPHRYHLGTFGLLVITYLRLGIQDYMGQCPWLWSRER